MPNEISLNCNGFFISKYSPNLLMDLNLIFKIVVYLSIVSLFQTYNTVGDKNLSVGKYDIKIYVGTKDKFPPPRQMWHKILCRNKRQICLGKYDNIIPFLFKHRLPCLITLCTDSIFQFFIPYRRTKVLW